MEDYIKYIRNKVGNDVVLLVGCGAFVYKDGKLLLQRRRDNGFWGPHGGCMNIGETCEEVARRELLEETGLVAGEMELLGVFSGPHMTYTYPNGDQAHWVVMSYVCQDFSGEILPENEEVAELAWFDIGNLPDEINPVDKEPVEAFLCWVKKG